VLVTTDGTVAGAVAWFECRVVDRFPAGQHLRYVDSDPGQFATSAMVTTWGRKPEEGETREGV
jgi:hypothetical protein